MNLIKEHFKNNKFDIIGYDYISYNDSIACDISHLPNKNMYLFTITNGL